jgi:ABC-2 type transport system ATP-binding protein
LVLDEPTTGVDPVSRRDFWKILAHLQREGLTLLLTTPYLDEAERCQRIALMDQAHILGVEEPEAIRARARGVVIEIVARPKRRAQELLRERSEVSEVEVFGERLHATLEGVAAADAALWSERLAAGLREHGIEVEHTRGIAPSLEDVFIRSIRARESAAGARA